MVLWMGGGRSRVRLSKRMILSGSLLMMVLFYYVSLPEPSMYPSGGADVGRKGFLADDTEIEIDTSANMRGRGARVSYGSRKEILGETIGKSSKQRNYNFEDTRAGTASCGLVNNDSSDSGSCAPASGKKHNELENNRFSIAIEEDVSTSEPSNASEVKVEWSKAKERESVQEDDDQGSEKEDGSMIESEEERVDREEKETIAATIEAEIEREEAELRSVNKAIKEAIEAFEDIVEEEEEEDEEEDVTSEVDLEKMANESDDEEDEEDEEDESATDGDMRQFVEGLFQSDRDRFTEEEDYRKEDRLGQAGPLETMDDEE